uniref:Uncharacterized protein n=1 Tax=Arundo donax TaxID=35708 RepID=A0A0A9D617_ARUDO
MFLSFYTRRENHPKDCFTGFKFTSFSFSTTILFSESETANKPNDFT